MAKLTLDTVRLGDARLMCGGELRLEKELPVAEIPGLVEQLADWVEADGGVRVDFALELALVCAGGEIRSGLNFRLRARDPYEDPAELGKWRDWLCERASARLDQMGVAYRFLPPAEEGTVCALPTEGFTFLQKKRRMGNLPGGGKPLYYYSASLEGFRLNLAAICRSLARGLRGGISLNLMPARRSAKDVRAIRAACGASATEDYLAAFRDMRDAPRHYSYVALVWGDAAWEVQDLLHAGGMEFSVARLPSDATLPYELALDPWAVNERLARRTGIGSLGSFACSLTLRELGQLFAAEETERAGDPLGVEVRPDGERLRALNAAAGDVLGGAAIGSGEGAVTMGEIMRALGELGQKLEEMKAPGDCARLADLERIQEELKRDVIAQARAAMDAQAEQLSDAVERINAHAQAAVDTQAEQLSDAVEQINAHARAQAWEAMDAQAEQLSDAVEQINAHAQSLAQAAVDAQAERLSDAVEQINAYTQAQVAPLAQRQAEAFDALFKASAEAEDRMDALMGKVSRVADQVGLRPQLTEQDLRMMGCESEEELVRRGLPEELLENLRYTVALYRLAGRMELSDDADCLPFGFMLGCFYEQIMMRCFARLYERDPEARTPLRLKNFDAMDNERIERYVRHVRFADGGAMDAADWIGWFNVLFALRQLRNRVHAEAGRLRRIDLDCMFRALLSDSAESRANLVARDYFRTDESGRRTESVFIPYNYRGDPAWRGEPGPRKWADQVADYIRSNPEPFRRSALEFAIACEGAEWR